MRSPTSASSARPPTATQAVAEAQRLRPDVCLFDIRMPGLDGIEATRRLAGPGVEQPVAVVVITTFDLDEYVHAALKAGARGFLLKDAGPDLLGQAVRAAPPATPSSPRASPPVCWPHSPTPAPTVPHNPSTPLTDREEEVLRRGRPGPDQHRDRRRTPHRPQHRQDPRRQPHDQARGPQSCRDRHVGLRDPPRRPLSGVLGPRTGRKDETRSAERWSPNRP